jgi:methylmalonyl-CoA decarboxylase subunit alpha
MKTKKNEYILKAEEDYKDKFANPYKAAEYGYIDDIIEPRNTRFRIIRALQALATKKDVMPAKKTFQHSIIRNNDEQEN